MQIFNVKHLGTIVDYWSIQYGLIFTLQITLDTLLAYNPGYCFKKSKYLRMDIINDYLLI